MRKIAYLGAPLASLALAAAPAGAQSVPTRGTLEACHTGPTAFDRYAVFAAQMGTIPGASKLQLRFDLLQRPPGAGSFQPLAAPGLGVWRSSTADIFRYRKQVIGLQPPGAYRAVVRFRWLDSAGTSIKAARRTTAICNQPDAGADLAVGLIEARDAGSGRYQYLVTVRNDGRSDAGAFDVALTLGSAAQPAETVEALAAGAKSVVTFVGPRCAPGDQITVQLDPSGQVEETDRADDRKVVDCLSAT